VLSFAAQDILSDCYETELIPGCLAVALRSDSKAHFYTIRLTTIEPLFVKLAEPHEVLIAPAETDIKLILELTQKGSCTFS
jgi:hypothetical protein